MAPWLAEVSWIKIIVFTYICKPTAFFSAKLSPTQSRYSTFSMELWEIYLTIKHFRHLLGDRNFSIFTDHKPLTTAMQNSSNKYTAHELKHLDYISQFTTDLRYVKGENNTVADTLSRTELNAVDNNIFSQDSIADEQKCDNTAEGIVWHFFGTSRILSSFQQQDAILRRQVGLSQTIHSAIA